MSITIELAKDNMGVEVAGRQLQLRSADDIVNNNIKHQLGKTCKTKLHITKNKKALLTRYCNNLSRVIERIDSAHTAAQASSDDATSPPRIKASLFELDATAKLAADALNAFTAALDEIDELPEEQDKQANDYIDSSLSLIERARLMAIELDAKNIGDREENDERGWTEMMRPKLPPIPIPIFTGKLQEYTNFWTLFESNVDRQPLTNLQKFNYLLTALQGNPEN
ncbi:hypothetical protein RB195_017743 [Necator americanus]|uniref:Uncharacterized protein n=1 Tax=Necator americanus TaxID=51031 RepID=A0ABR1C6L2_NECAM